MAPQQSVFILVVEDEPLIRMDVVATVEGAGFTAFEAGNADQAVRLLEERADIQVLLTDVEMPGSMDGVVLAHYAQAQLPAIKIIVTSGRRKIEAKDLPPQAAFLGKPCRPDHIVAKLRAMTS